MSVSENLIDGPDNDSGSVKLPRLEDIVCILKTESEKGDIYKVLSLEADEVDEPSSVKLRHTMVTVDDTEAFNQLQSVADDFLLLGPPVHLQPCPQRHVHVVVSTHSGTGQSLSFYNNVLAPLFQELGLSESSNSEQDIASSQGYFDLLITKDADSVKTFARKLAVTNCLKELGEENTVVLLSGDGGVVDMLNGYASVIDNRINSGVRSEPPRKPLIVVLPLGTGNALFSSLHKTVDTPAAASDLVRGLRTMLRGRSAQLPSFKAEFSENSRLITYSETSVPTSAGNETKSSHLKEKIQSVSHLYGVVVASYGFHSQLVWESDTPEYRQHGAKRFQMVAEELKKESHAYYATLQAVDTIERTTFTMTLKRDKHSYILATLVSNLQETFCISPSSKPLDGQLRLVHFGPVDGEMMQEIMMAAYDGGKHVGMRWGGGPDGKGDTDGVEYEKIENIKITIHEKDPRWRKVCIDGTIVEIPADGCVVISKATRHHLSVLVDSRIL